MQKYTNKYFGTLELFGTISLHNAKEAFLRGRNCLYVNAYMCNVKHVQFSKDSKKGNTKQLFRLLYCNIVLFFNEKECASVANFWLQNDSMLHI